MMNVQVLGMVLLLMLLQGPFESNQQALCPPIPDMNRGEGGRNITKRGKIIILTSP